SRGPWRLKAFLDPEGHGVTNSFLTIRPRTPDLPLEVLWALCNSPFANAYDYTHSVRRHILTSTLRGMRVPAFTSEDAQRITRLVRDYLQAVNLASSWPGSSTEE